MRLLKTITRVEQIKERFLNKEYSNCRIYKSYCFNENVDIDTSRKESEYTFECGNCDRSYYINELQIKNNIIQCECGHRVHLKDIPPVMSYKDYPSKVKMLHNCKNGTVNKFNVPTIVGDAYLYCNKCHKTHDFRYKEYERESETLICECGNRITFEECKLVSLDYIEPTIGGVFYDVNKISVSFKGYRYMFKTPRGEEKGLYWQEGSTRLTLNLETGYSYLSNKGAMYSSFNEIWRRMGHEGKAPSLMNATYCNEYMFDDIMDHIAMTYTNKLAKKYYKNEHLFDLVYRRKTRDLHNAYKYKHYKEMDLFMSCYLNRRYSYHIKSIEEIANFYSLNLFIKHNRYINVDLKQLQHLDRFFYNLKLFNNTKDKYSVVDRESNNIIADYMSAKYHISKSLKKQIIKDLPTIYHHTESNFYALFNFMKFITKKENANKVYNTFMNQDGYIFANNFVLENWFKLRSEEYIANLSMDELQRKYYFMSDGYRLLKKIREVYGDTYDIEFKTEKQYHDKLTDIFNSNSFRTTRENMRKKELTEPFKLEEDCLKLESNDITIARTEQTLVDIGKEMDICVGGYGNDVRKTNCRIAYMKVNGVYKVCLELRRNEKKNKIIYRLKQAKMKHNRLVKDNKEYYTIVKEWCDNNNISISTGDM